MQGIIVQIIGVVVDVQFPEGNVPALYEALLVRVHLWRPAQWYLRWRRTWVTIE